MARSLTDIPSLFASLGGNAAVARILSVGPSTASEMKRRGSIPVEHWPALIASEPARAVRLTADDLMRMHSARPAPSQSEGKAA